MSRMNEGELTVFGDTCVDCIDNVDNVEIVIESRKNIDHDGTLKLSSIQRNISVLSISGSRKVTKGINNTENIIDGNGLDTNQSSSEIRTAGEMEAKDAGKEGEQEDIPAKSIGALASQVSITNSDLNLAPNLTSHCVVNNVEIQNDWINELSDVGSLNSDPSIETDYENIVDLHSIKCLNFVGACSSINAK